jgi:pyruvate/2-oxoglutarate dehydrogenase complex dihydrolipoamide dehydrogenase (E3) component
VTDRAQADVVVIGGGPTGVAAAASARAASGGSARVVLVDDGAHGPRPVAGRPVAALLREAAAAGLGWDAARTAARSALADAGTPDAAALDGVRVVLGRASLAGRGTVEVERAGADAAGGPLRIATKRVVLATGSAPALPDVTGLVDTRYVTPDTLLDVVDLPPTVAVVGAGRRGVALAQALARFGVTVTLVDAEERVLPGLDADVSATIETALRKDGVRLLLGSRVVKVAPTLDGGAWVGTEAGSDVAAELLVVTTGRRADLAGLDLPSAGVTVGRAGAVTVDDRLRTSEPTVLAAGPVAGRRPDLRMARLAGANAVARLRAARWTPGPLVLSVQTHPAVAVVGVGESEAARTEGARVHELVGSSGLVRVVVSGGRDPRVLGATVVTTGAADAAAVAALVIAGGLPPQRLADLAEPGTALATLAAALARPGRRPGTAVRSAG